MNVYHLIYQGNKCCAWLILSRHQMLCMAEFLAGPQLTRQSGLASVCFFELFLIVSWECWTQQDFKGRIVSKLLVPFLHILLFFQIAFQGVINQGSVSVLIFRVCRLKSWNLRPSREDYLHQGCCCWCLHKPLMPNENKRESLSQRIHD